jgi:hypothetical protein
MLASESVPSALTKVRHFRAGLESARKESVNNQANKGAAGNAVGLRRSIVTCSLTGVGTAAAPLTSLS